MKGKLAFLGLLALFVAVSIPFTEYQKNRPMHVKLGYLPHPKVIRLTTGEHQTTVASMMALRVIFYYGTLIQEANEEKVVRPEYYNMFKTLEGVVHVDPYNMDAYYFSQAVFTWDVGRIKEVNHLLEKGMKFRTWDPWLPFFLAFNHFYFFQNPGAAAPYMQKAATLSGNPLFTNLAARYFYESDQANFGLVFLEEMIQQTQHPAIRAAYEKRRDALLAVVTIEEAIKEFQALHQIKVVRLSQLVEAGILLVLPEDPYGGTFYLTKENGVRSTSNFVSHSPPSEQSEVAQ